MRPIANFEVLDHAHRLVLEVYRLTERFPPEERYGLTSQLRRAATSVPLNVAEGAGRGSDKDFARFVNIAVGSVNELEYGLNLCRDLGYISAELIPGPLSRLQRVRKMLSGLLQALDPT